MSDIMMKDVLSVKVEVLQGSPTDTEDVDIKIVIETPMYLVEAFDFCERETALDYAYVNLKNILSRPAINDTGPFMRYLFDMALDDHEDGKYVYPKWQFVDERWKKSDIKTFEADFSRHHLQGIIDYDFENDSEVVNCHRDFIKSFIRVDIIDELPF